jgi:ketosteroid isomerase-like protein
MSQENVEIVLAFVDASNARDREQLEAVRAPEFEKLTARERDGMPVPSSTDRYLDEIDEAWKAHRVEVEQIVDLGDRIVVLGHIEAEGRTSGVQLSQPVAGIYAVVDGRVARVDGFHIWDEALEAAGLSE